MSLIKGRKYIRLCVLLIMTISMLSISAKVYAATPRLMVTDYSVAGGSVVGGKEFDLKIILTNTATRTAVKNIKVTIATENGEMLPVEGAGTTYIESMAANTEEELTFKMKAVKGLEEKSYKMIIKTEYESSSGMEYTVEDSIFLPVTMEQRLMVTDVYVAGNDIHIGEDVEVTAKVSNLGEGSLYNVTVELYGDGIDSMNTYLGNIESGKSGNVDIITTASEVTNDNSKAYLKIIYEDVDGNKKEEQYELGQGVISVQPPIYDELELVKGKKETKKDWGFVKWVLIGFVGVAIAVVVSVRKIQRKKKILEEF